MTARPEATGANAVKGGVPVVKGAAGRERAEARLRAEIDRGDLVPGQRLVEPELAERFGVTRGSARLALDALVADGLVERIPNRGGRVRSISTAEAVGIFECRMVLDGLLARKAVENGTEAELAAIAANVSNMERAVAGRDLVTYRDLIQLHHSLVRAAAKHPVATEIVERLVAQMVRHQSRIASRLARAQQSLHELHDVADAIIDRDARRAEELVREHFRGLIAAVLAESHGDPSLR